MSDLSTQYDEWVDELESPEEDAAVAAAEHDDDKAAKQARVKKAHDEEDGVVTKAEYMADKFLSGASEEEARLFAIYRRGDEDARQLKGIIELAKTKAAEAAKALGQEVEEKAEKLADKKAADAYGVGPLAPGAPSREMTPQELFDARKAKAKETGSSHSFYELYRDLPAEAEASA